MVVGHEALHRSPSRWPVPVLGNPPSTAQRSIAPSHSTGRDASVRGKARAQNQHDQAIIGPRKDAYQGRGVVGTRMPPATRRRAPRESRLRHARSNRAAWAKGAPFPARPDPAAPRPGSKETRPERARRASHVPRRASPARTGTHLPGPCPGSLGGRPAPAVSVKPRYRRALARPAIRRAVRFRPRPPGRETWRATRCPRRPALDTSGRRVCQPAPALADPPPRYYDGRHLA